MLEDEVDDEGDVKSLVVGGHDDAVRALAARRRFHRRPTWTERRIAPSDDLYVGFSPSLGLVELVAAPCRRSRRWGRGRRHRRDELGVQPSPERTNCGATTPGPNSYDIMNGLSPRRFLAHTHIPWKNTSPSK